MMGQETLMTARPGHASEFSAGQLPQYAEDTLIIHDDDEVHTVQDIRKFP